MSDIFDNIITVNLICLAQAIDTASRQMFRSRDKDWTMSEFRFSGAGLMKSLVLYRFVVKYPKKRGTKYLSLCLELSRGNLSKVDKA